MLTETIIGVFYDVYNELGGGFLESVYSAAMSIALSSKGLKVQTEIPVPVYFRGHPVGNFRADILVEQVVLLELKAVSALDRTHDGQMLNYLRATEIEIGLLLNFGPKPQVKRYVLGNDKKKIRVDP